MIDQTKHSPAHCKKDLRQRLLASVCKTCARRRAQMWRAVYRFDAENSWERELWEEQPERLNGAFEAACEVRCTDPPAALPLFENLASQGHPFAMHAAAYAYEWGKGVSENLDRALHYYYDALCAGSWHASVKYASLLYRLGFQQEASEVLERAIANNHLPSLFWYHFQRTKRPYKRSLIKEIRPDLVKLTEAGHPGGEWMLSMFSLRGHYGLSGIRDGWRMALKSANNEDPD